MSIPHTQNKEGSFLLSGDLNSQTLLVVFGGINGRAGGMTFFEFERITSNLPARKMFIRDSRQAWYQRGLPELGTSVLDIANYLKTFIDEHNLECIFMGNSSGGFAALLFGYLIGIKQVLAFSPQTFIDPHNRLRFLDFRWPLRITHMQLLTRSQKRFLDLQELLSTQSSHPTRFDIHYSSSHRLDKYHAKHLAGCPNVNLTSYPYHLHSLVRHLRDQGLLLPIVEDTLT